MAVQTPETTTGPAASIGIPFVNNISTLRLAIQSVFAQTRDDWELLLLDDGSSDGSLQLAQSVRDHRVRVLTDGLQRGLADRLNELTAASRAAVVVRMDADDVMHPERLERQLAALHADPELDAVCSPAFVIDGQDVVRGVTGEQAITDDPALFFANRVIVHPTLCARREWMANNPYDPALKRSQDKELFTRAHAHTRFFKVPEPLLFYRELGQFRWDHYRAQRRLERSIYRRHGARLGRGAQVRMMAGSRSKELVYNGLHRVGLAAPVHEAMSGRQARPLNRTEVADAKQSFKRVITQAVPGLDLDA